MVEELAGIFANHFGWTPEQRDAEVARTLSILADRHGVILPQEHPHEVSETKDRF
jgi:hypothetical protein